MNDLTKLIGILLILFISNAASASDQLILDDQGNIYSKVRCHDGTCTERDPKGRVIRTAKIINGIVFVWDGNGKLISADGKRVK